MRTLEFLRRLHETLLPPTYLEIGVRWGDSLAHSRSPSIGIDPAFNLSQPPPERATLFEETSDAYFERENPLGPFGGRPASLALIDGMHLSEYALRDFINVERHAHWSSVIVFDDILPGTVEVAARNQTTRVWAGDVYKILEVLWRHRPDLIQIPVLTKPTGILLVTALDPESRVLSDSYERIVESMVSPDPQPVPQHVLDREGALEPEAVLNASFWSSLRDARDTGVARREGVRRMRAEVREDLGLKGASRVRRALARRARLPAG